MADKLILCTPCLFVEKEVKAVGFCSTCAECLCLQCVTDHRKLKVTRNHEVYKDSIPDNLELIREMNEMLSCTIHKEMKISYRCYDHSIGMCTVCRVDIHRNCKHVLEIEKAAASERILEKVQENLEELILFTESLKERKERKRKVLYQSRADILNEQEVLIQRSINALEKLKTELARETGEYYQIALSDIDKDIASVEVMKQNVNKSVGILEAANKYGDSVSPQVIGYLLADATENDNKLVKYLDSKIGHRLVFIKNEKCSQLPSPGTVSLILDNESEKTELVESGIDKTSDAVAQCDDSSSHTVNTPINQTLHSLPTTSEGFVITQKQEIMIRTVTDKYCSAVYGILVLTDGRLILIDHTNSNIKLLSPDYKLIHVLRLPGYPIRLCALGHTVVAVSFLRLKRIIRYCVVGNTISYEGEFKISLFNHGIGFDGNSIVAIMCSEDFGFCNNAKDVNIRVEFRNPLNGYINAVVKDFKVEGSNKTWSLTLTNTQAVHCTDDGDMLIAELNRLLCFSYEESRKIVAKEKMFYVCKEEVRPNDIENIATDGDSILVCTRSGSVLQLSSTDFNSHRIIVQETGEIFSAIAVDSTNGRLILGCNGKDSLNLYEFKRNV